MVERKLFLTDIHFISSLLVGYATYSPFAARLLRYIMIHPSCYETKDVSPNVC